MVLESGVSRNCVRKVMYCSAHALTMTGMSHVSVSKVIP